VSVESDALAYHRDTSTLNRQAVALILRLWRQVDVGNISASWGQLLADAVPILIAAQTVAAELVDPYLTQVLDDAGTSARRVDVGGLIGPGAQELLYEPAIKAKAAIGNGLGPNLALQAAGKLLSTYVQTTAADTGRLAVAAGMAARSHVSGYYRMLRPPSCSRCAILAGKHFKWNRGFQRHPRCDCVHIPVQETDDSLLFDPRKAIEAGQVTGLSQANTKAIVEHGADPAQVVNAEAGMYDAGQFKYTTTGTTRRAVAGARILAKDIDRAFGIDVAKQTYTNVAFDRQKVAHYAEMLRRGKTYTRLTRSGRWQQYAYRYTRTSRPTPSQIIDSAGSRAEATRLLTNYGYIL
jgi:hypothetical protein